MPLLVRGPPRFGYYLRPTNVPQLRYKPRVETCGEGEPCNPISISLDTRRRLSKLHF